MPMRRPASVAVCILLLLAAGASAQTDEKEKGKDADAKAEKTRSKIETATFGAGCFWSTEAVFERVPGVRAVTSGFAGGAVPYPSYDQVCTGMTGHAEVVQVEYDASVVPYEKLLALFFKAHDPTTLNRQGDDYGTQYRSVIFYHNEDQRKAALAAYKDLTSRRAFRSPIVTDLVRYQAFYPAEPYHQDYYVNHAGNVYSTVYIEPKLKKLNLMPTRIKKPRTVAKSKAAKPADDPSREGEAPAEPSPTPPSR